MATTDTNKDFLLTSPNSAFANNASGQNDQYVMASNAPSIPSDTSEPQLSNTQGLSGSMYRVPTSGVGPSGEKIYDVFSGNEHIADPNDPRLKGVDIMSLPTGQAPTGFKSKFEQGFEKANAAMGDAAKDVSDSNAASIVQQYAPESRNDLASTFVKTDPYIEDLVKTWQEYINPENQRTSLADTYKQMIADSGVQALDMELIDAKAVIEGTEDDLRTEITKAGGFATESQIQALTNARNKSLIKNYNTLLETRNAKASYLNTMIGLEAQDRQAADARFESMFNMGIQIANYQQQMQQNAQSQMQWLTQNIGFDGLYEATGGDPYYVNLVEQTLGMPSGALKIASDQAIAARATEEENAQLDLQLKMSQLETNKAQRAKIYSDMTKVTQNIEKVNGQDVIVTKNASGAITDITPVNLPGAASSPEQIAQAKGNIDALTDLSNDKYLSSAVGPNKLARTSIFEAFTGGKANFIAGIEQIRSQLTLDSLINAKAKGATFGALSEGEMAVLSNAASKLGSWIVPDSNGNVVGYKASEAAFKEELDKINNYAKLDYIYRGGSMSEVGVQQMEDGTLWTRNSDGSMTQIK